MKNDYGGWVMGRSERGERAVVGGSWVKERDDEGLMGNGGRLGDWRLGGEGVWSGAVMAVGLVA